MCTAGGAVGQSHFRTGGGVDATERLITNIAGTAIEDAAPKGITTRRYFGDIAAAINVRNLYPGSSRAILHRGGDYVGAPPMRGAPPDARHAREPSGRSRLIVEVERQNGLRRPVMAACLISAN
jgi:hypothetical protein